MLCLKSAVANGEGLLLSLAVVDGQSKPFAAASVLIIVNIAALALTRALQTLHDPGTNRVERLLDFLGVLK